MLVLDTQVLVSPKNYFHKISILAILRVLIFAQHLNSRTTSARKNVDINTTLAYWEMLLSTTILPSLVIIVKRNVEI